MIHKKKSFWQRIAKIKRICNEIDIKINYHETMYVFYTKLSLDYSFFICEGDHISWKTLGHDEVQLMMRRAQSHLAKRTHYIRKLIRIQDIAKENNLTFFVSAKKVHEKSYFDRLLN